MSFGGAIWYDCGGIYRIPDVRLSTGILDRVELLDDHSKGVWHASLMMAQPSMSIPPPMKTHFFLGCVVACFFFTTLGISNQFAISALYWKRIWGVSPDIVGTIMAIGECVGTCCLVFFKQPVVFNSPVTKFFGKPANVLNACLGMGLGCWLITTNSKIVCAIATVGVHMFNVCVHSFQLELIGICASGESFGKWISISYVVKRAANCVCVFGSIVLFDASGPQASYRCIGSGLILYAAILGSIFAYQKMMPCQRLEVPETE